MKICSFNVLAVANSAAMSNRNFHSLLMGKQNGSATLEDNLAFPFLQNILLPYNPAITLLGIYPKEMKTSVQSNSVTQSYPALCDPMNHSTPALPVHHQLPEFTQTHVH